MKKVLFLLAALVMSVSSVWAQGTTVTSVTEGGRYYIKAHFPNGQAAQYLYDNGTKLAGSVDKPSNCEFVAEKVSGSQAAFKCGDKYLQWTSGDDPGKSSNLTGFSTTYDANLHLLTLENASTSGLATGRFTTYSTENVANLVQIKGRGSNGTTYYFTLRNGSNQNFVAAESTNRFYDNNWNNSTSEYRTSFFEIVEIEGGTPPEKTTWDHTDLVDGKTVRFRSYWENTKFLGTKSDKTGLEATASQETTFVIVESEEGSGQYYLYDAANEVFVGKTQASASQNVPVTANVADAGLFQFVQGTATGKDDTKPRVAIKCVNPLNTGHVMLHHAQGSDAINYGGNDSYSYGGNGWQVVSLVDAADSDYQAACDKLHPAGIVWTALDNALTEANACNIGTGLGQYSSSQSVNLTEINDFVTTFKGHEELAELMSMTQAELQEQINTYATQVNNMVTGLQLNMPQPGTFLRMKGVQNTTNYLTSGTAANGKYTMGPGTCESIFYYDGEHLLNYSTGRYVGVTSVSWAWTAVGGTGSAIGFTDCSTKGAYLVTIPGTSTYTCLYSGAAGATSADRGGMNSKTTDSKYHWTLEEVAELPVAFHENGQGYATLYAPVALTIPAGVEAYTLHAGEDEYLHTNGVETTIHANTAVVLKGTANSTENFAISSEEGTVDNENVLVGTVATIAAGDDKYVFSIVGGQAGFYKFGGTALAGFKAYIESNVETQGFVINFGGLTTGINNVNANVNANHSFDLQGRRVSKATRGLFIQNGVKVIR